MGELLTKNNKLTKKIFRFIILVISTVVGGVFILVSINKEYSMPLVIEESVTQSSFTEFVGTWNDKVRVYGLSEKHLLSSSDDKEALEKLQSYIGRLTSPLSASTSQELETISARYQKSIWKFYKDFLFLHLSKKNTHDIKWSELSSSDELAQLVQRITVNKDYDESIKLILASHNPCVYFLIYKYDLWKHGLSKNFNKCTMNIINGDEFPALAEMMTLSIDDGD